MRVSAEGTTALSASSIYDHTRCNACCEYSPLNIISLARMTNDDMNSRFLFHKTLQKLQLRLFLISLNPFPNCIIRNSIPRPNFYHRHLLNVKIKLLFCWANYFSTMKPIAFYGTICGSINRPAAFASTRNINRLFGF